MKGHWDRFWGKHETGARPPSYSKQRIMAVLSRHLKPRMRVLDAGCGSGFFTGFFANNGCATTAVDYSERAVELARRAGDDRAHCVVADLLSPGLPLRFDATFDLIFTDGLFEHFSGQDQLIIMGNFLKMRSERGIVATFVPGRYSAWRIIRPFLMPGIKEKPFTMERLRSLNADLSILEEGGLNVLPLPWSPDRRLGRVFGMILYVIAA